ncbi:MAG: site-specific integrase [Gammaproteobacteria bacterium]|jgi:integrase|nr:site-specific integrase [Gammaproteobacteria bacterium]
MKLTDRQVLNLKPKEDRYEVWEGKGFGVRVFPSGKKSWVFMYRFHGKARRLTFGNYPSLSVAEAHAAHAEALMSLEQGIDPGVTKAGEKLADRQALTVEGLITEYLDKWAKPRKRSWKEDERILKRDVSSAWGRMKAKDVRRRDVVLLIDKIADRAPIMANRTLAVVRRMFNFAIERDIVEMSPCTVIKLPSKETRRDRVLNEHEIKTFWQSLDKSEMNLATILALKMQLITAQRKTEVATMRWDEINFDDGIWTIPAEKSKNGKPHRVPLSDMAKEILTQSKAQLCHDEYVFPSPSKDSSISTMAINKAVYRNQMLFDGVEKFTPHDLRRTAASQMTALGISRLVVSKILNHSESSVTAIYDRHTYENEKKAALTAWSIKLKGLFDERQST